MVVRKIIHVDMDAFFASVEQRDDPTLRGRPVAVGHAAARGVVAAASYEARRFGVRSALPSVTALRRCPDLVFVPPRFEVYRGVSRQIHEVFSRYADLIQPLSLDEAYLDVTADKRGLDTAWLTAKAIRADIMAETGLTASAGISYNKFLAKLASDHRKPNGQFAVTPEMGAAWVETLPVSRFHGVGPVTAEKMKRLGIETGADLRSKSLTFLERHFGSSAGWYHAIARGVDERPVNPNRTRKSSGSETTFDRDLTEAEEIEAGVLRMPALRSEPRLPECGASRIHSSSRRAIVPTVRTFIPAVISIAAIGLAAPVSSEPTTDVRDGAEASSVRHEMTGRRGLLTVTVSGAVAGTGRLLIALHDRESGFPGRGKHLDCQSASKKDPLSASKRDPLRRAA